MIRILCSWGVLLLVVSGIFCVFPHIDLAAAQVFFTPEEGFFLKNNTIIRFLYASVPVMVRVAIAGAALTMLILLIWKRPLGRIGKKEVLYLVLALSIGPGLVVNTVFKEHFGRARPAQITEFGGSKQFTPPFVISDQCERNCSFVSGHAAVGFYCVAFAFLVGRYRKTALALSIIPGILIGFARMAQGGHFLSDVIFAGIFTVMVSQLLYEVVIKKKLHAIR